MLSEYCVEMQNYSVVGKVIQLQHMDIKKTGLCSIYSAQQVFINSFVILTMYEKCDNLYI